MPKNSSDQALSVFIVGITTMLLIGAGLAWERYSAKASCVFFILLQIFLTAYGMAIKPERPGKNWWRGDAFDSAVFLITNTLVLPLFLRSAFHAFHSEAFTLGSSGDTLWNWMLYVCDQIIDAVALGIPSTFSFAFTHIQHSGRYGPFIVSYVRLIVVAQFILVVLHLWKSRRKLA
jgi:hypothetical protein